MTSRGRVLRAAALIAVAGGAVASLGFLLRAGQRTPLLLLVILAVWVFLPFAALLVANAISHRWPAPTRTTLHGAMLFVALASVALYADDAVHPHNPPALVFVAVPPASGLLTAVALSVAALISGRRSGRNGG